MTKRKTTEEFKNEIRSMHGDRYGLDLVEYINNKTKVKLICRKHGVFEMSPNCLLSGQNCPKCSKEELSRSMTHNANDVIARFKAIQGDRYGYEKVVYEKMLKKVCFTCKEHGDFWMTPSHFLEGHGCPECGKMSRSQKRAKTFNSFVDDANKVHNNKYTHISDGYRNNRSKVKIICHIHSEFEQKSLDHIQGKGCPRCGHITSKAEDEIHSYIRTFVNENDIVRHDNKLLDGLETDIYLPKFGISFEFDGLRWHSEEFCKDRNYHLLKTEISESKGVHLIHIFEDEWIEHHDLVLEKIRHFLGKNDSLVIGARKCTIKLIHKDDAKPFLDRYHIQGWTTSTLYYGAFYNNNLVGVMSFLREYDGNWNLTRFTTDSSYRIPGLANKIFKKFVTENNPIQVKTFLDRRWSHSNCNVYDRMGFKLDKTLKPDYRYVVGNKRMHKFGFRKQILHRKYGLPLSMTEKEMCDKLGFHRIWDCGLFRYVWKKNT